MPTYGYRCQTNGHEFEVGQAISEAPLTKCQVCGAPVRRIFYPVGIVFKGQGFYKTDSRAAAKSAAGTTSKEAEKTDTTDKKGSPAETPGKDATPEKSTPKASSEKPAATSG